MKLVNFVGIYFATKKRSINISAVDYIQLQLHINVKNTYNILLIRKVKFLSIIWREVVGSECFLIDSRIIGSTIRFKNCIKNLLFITLHEIDLVVYTQAAIQVSVTMYSSFFEPAQLFPSILFCKLKKSPRFIHDSRHAF